MKFKIFCWSDIKGDYAPSAHPEFTSSYAARTYGEAHIKTLDFIVQPC